MWQMARIMYMSMRHSLRKASACRGMPCDMKIRSAKCQSHQRFGAAYDEYGVSKLHQPVTEKNQMEFTGLVPQFFQHEV